MSGAATVPVVTFTVRGVPRDTAATRFPDTGQSKVTRISPTRCGFSAKLHATSTTRPSLGMSAFDAHEARIE